MNIATRACQKVLDACRFIVNYGQHLPLAMEMIFSLRCDVVTLQGTLRNGGAVVSLLYVGRRRNFDYVRRLVFDQCRELQSSSVTLLTVRQHLDQVAANIDLVIVDIGWPYHGRLNRDRRYLEIPDWVNMSMELPERWEDVVLSFRQTTRNNDLRLIRRNEYRFELTRDRKVIEDFYDAMYLPFVSHKHATDSVIASRRHVIKRAMTGQLLRVLRGDEVVAAGVIHADDSTLYFLWMGLPGQHLDAPPEGAISALYYFGIRYAFDSGCRNVDFTGTRAFLSDGAFRFKRKWGASVDDTFSPSSLLLRPVRGSRGAALFCAQFPVLTRTHGGLGAVFTVVDKPVDTASIVRLQKESLCAGVARMTVLRISDRNETTSLPDTVGECQCRVTDVSLDSFADRYVEQVRPT